MNTNNDISLPFHDKNEIKQTIVNYEHLQTEIDTTQGRLRELKKKKQKLSSSLKCFMKFNNIKKCLISEDIPTTIREVRYTERNFKERISLNMVKLYFEEFFENIETDRFLNLSSGEKTECFFDFLESKRHTTVKDTIIIK